MDACDRRRFVELARPESADAARRVEFDALTPKQQEQLLAAFLRRCSARKRS
jgi:hypothetical protein